MQENVSFGEPWSSSWCGDSKAPDESIPAGGALAKMPGNGRGLNRP
jgi:hypothetical protein